MKRLVTYRDAAHAADDHVQRRFAQLHAAMRLLQALEPLLQAESAAGGGAWLTAGVDRHRSAAQTHAAHMPFRIAHIRVP